MIHYPYIAAGLSDRDLANGLAITLKQYYAACIPVSSWHTRPSVEESPVHLLEAIGWRNICDLHRATELILLRTHPSSSGGRHFEHGWAAGREMPVHIIGGSDENVFQRCYKTTFTPTVKEFVSEVAPWLYG